MEKLYKPTSKTFLKMLVRGCIPLILPPGFAIGHKQRKLSKESGIFDEGVEPNPNRRFINQFYAIFVER